MLKKLRNKIFDCDSLYVWFMTMKKWHDPNLARLLRGFYHTNCGVETILVQHFGNMEPEKIIYNINFDKTNERGFFSLLRYELLGLAVAEKLHFTPCVKWGHDLLYYDEAFDKITDNVHDYFFESIGMNNTCNIQEYKNVVFFEPSHINLLKPNLQFYNYDDEELKLLACMYRKYIKLNQRTKEYIDSQLPKIMRGKKTLGIHIRGTDFAQDHAAHPLMVPIGDYINKTKEIMATKKYEQIFLATDDLNILRAFIEAFNNGLVYFTDTMRSENSIGVHNQWSERPLHRYMLGLEVLRDVYTLAYCDGLVAGISNVSFAARYINLALNRNYSTVSVLDKGIVKV